MIGGRRGRTPSRQPIPRRQHRRIQRVWVNQREEAAPKQELHSPLTSSRSARQFGAF